jgi:hypothetical protein
MRIAICLSGQPRSIQYTKNGILHHFSGNHTYDFFCHSWNANSWKIKKDQVNWGNTEKVDEVDLETQLLEFSPKYYKISDSSVLGSNSSVPWQSLFYSFMYSVYLKKKYEIENNFRYDLVVKCRYDLAFDPNFKFNPKEKFHSLDINTAHGARMARVYQRTNVSDVIFFGSSTAMDIMADIYWHTYHRKRMSLDDFESIDPGILMYKYGTENNLVFRFDQPITETVYRREMIPTDSIQGYRQINDTHLTYYSYP